MSLAENYHKVGLGIAGFTVVAVAGLLFLGSSKLEEDFQDPPQRMGDVTTVKNSDKAKWVLASMGAEKSVTVANVAGRQVETFISLPLVVDKDNPNTVKDLLSEYSEPVHPPIPNLWWKENNLDLQYEDSPQRDADGDGFSNLEEFHAQTAPNDAKSFPDLLAKLKVKRIKEEKALLTFMRAGEDGIRARVVTIVDGVKERIDTKVIAPGQVFPEKGKYEGVFKYLGREDKQFVDPRTKVAQKIMVATVEDARPNFKQRAFDVLERNGPRRIVKKGAIVVDRSAVFTLEAVGEAGQEHTIMEGQSFSLPFGQEVKPYTITSIAENGEITISRPETEQPLKIKP